MELHGRPDRDPELVKYLARVEQLDSERNGAKRVSDDKLRYRPEDLERAQKLLNGDYLTSEERPNGSRLQKSSEMAYKSAYNYEKTFSPKRNRTYTNFSAHRERSPEALGSHGHSGRTVSRFDSHESSRQYTISEEDYLLLRKFKQGLLDLPPASNDESRFVPSRGRPRAVKDVEDSSDDELRPPALPIRRSMAPRTHTTSSEKTAPMKPPRPAARAGSTQEGPSSPIQLSTSNGSPTLDASQASRVNPIQDSKITTNSNLQPEGSSKQPKKPTSYLDSLQKNKVTVTTPLKAEPITPSPIKPVRPVQPFMTSALKNESSESFHKTKRLAIPAQRKQLPAKQTPGGTDLGFDSFRSKLKTVSKDGGNQHDTKPTENNPAAMEFKLRAVKTTKMAPEEEQLAFRGKEVLRPSTTTSEAKLQIPKTRKATPEEKYLALKGKEALRPIPAVSERKVSIPEAVSKKGKLNKAPPKPERKISMPEAVSKRNSLAKAPPKPSRKISMPEAMKRLEAMKAREKSNSAHYDAKNTSSSKETDGKLEAVLLSKHLSNRGRSKTTPDIEPKGNLPIAIPFMAQTKDAKIAKMLRPAATTDFSELQSSNNAELTHPTKSRARGPKRKPPKGF
ncbi:LANO_0H00716g1_1 [Lachancea nothofagi CBS 11611]|uniref:LANO_0H00716g1_1 n=1 Tax=Lachancea nothofagi CBS 11611 TaxID=1266666 RepID=A0A1G4KKP2_9SACH|nr:LANO_0H00716g1_1 [Lachancea nothofagi CBS 11611]